MPAKTRPWGTKLVLGVWLKAAVKELVVGKATCEPEGVREEKIKVNQVARHPGATQSWEKKGMSCSSTGHGVRCQPIQRRGLGRAVVFATVETFASSKYISM